MTAPRTTERPRSRPDSHTANAAPDARPRRYRMTIAYDGTNYAGWQVQPNGVTVQEKIEQALARISGAAVKIHGSGRTDQGVHARGQVAHFETVRLVRPAMWLKALNAILPSDIRVLALRKAADDFHARRSATGKEYRYFIWDGPLVPPFVRQYRAHVPRRLDVAAMRAAAAGLVGVHDFAAFAANADREVESSVRHLRRLTVTRRGHEVTIAAEADGFLYRMVRSLAGWLIRVGEGSVPASRTREILESRERTARVPTAPAAGLFLWRVDY